MCSDCAEPLLLRPLRGTSDAESLHAVRVGCAAADAVDPLSLLEAIPSLAQVQRTLEDAAGQADRWVVAEVDDQVAGYGCVRTWREADGTQVYLCLGWVLPAQRGRGIGTALLQWAEECSRRLAAAQPGSMAELAANASGAQPDAAALLRAHGYRIAYTVLELELDASQPPISAVLPDGFVVVPAAAAHLPLIAASVWESYHDEYPGGRFNNETEAATLAEELTGGEYDRSLWQVAWAGDQVAGQVLARLLDQGRAEIFEVSVRRPWRRRGLARALLVLALAELHRRGAAVIRLHTVAEFPTCAVDLYRSAGFRVVKAFPRYRKTMNV